MILQIMKTTKKIHLCINNNIYDVSEFSKIHPGGNIINFYNCINNNIDATHAFNTFHLRSKKAYKMLNGLKIIERKTHNNSDFYKLINLWKLKGYYKTKYKFLFYGLSSPCLLVILVIYCYIMNIQLLVV